MRKGIVLLPFLLLGCASQTPEEAEAAKYNAPKMMSDAEVKANEAAHPDPRKGGAIPPPPPGQGK